MPLEADARAHEPAELCFGFVVAPAGDSSHQVGVAQPHDDQLDPEVQRDRSTLHEKMYDETG